MSRLRRNHFLKPNCSHARGSRALLLAVLILLAAAPLPSFGSRICEGQFLSNVRPQNAPTRLKFLAKKMDADMYDIDIHKTKTRYYNEEERKIFKIFVRGGLLFNSRGELLNIRNAIFVMDAPSGDIFVMQSSLLTPHDRAWWHHSSPLAGGPVGAAGNMDVENGRLVYINDDSGHYAPKLPFLKQALTRLQELGADLSETSITDYLGIPLELEDLPDFTPKDIEKLEAHNAQVDSQAREP